MAEVSRMNRLAHHLKTLGWEVRCNRHWVARSPDGQKRIVFNRSPSDNFAVKNIQRDLNKLGVNFQV